MNSKPRTDGQADRQTYQLFLHKSSLPLFPGHHAVLSLARDDECNNMPNWFVMIRTDKTELAEVPHSISCPPGPCGSWWRHLLLAPLTARRRHSRQEKQRGPPSVYLSLSTVPLFISDHLTKVCRIGCIMWSKCVPWHVHGTLGCWVCGKVWAQVRGEQPFSCFYVKND